VRNDKNPSTLKLGTRSANMLQPKRDWGRFREYFSNNCAKAYPSTALQTLTGSNDSTFRVRGWAPGKRSSINRAMKSGRQISTIRK